MSPPPRTYVADWRILEANFQVPMKVFLCAMEHDLQRVITAGTGLPHDFNMYTKAKKLFADMGHWYCNRPDSGKQELQFWNVKLENIYGEDEPGNRFLPGTIDKLRRNEPVPLTLGDQIRDFIYIEDVVSNFVSLIEANGPEGYLDIPLGTGEGVAVRDVVCYLKEVTNSDSPLLFGAVPKRINEPDSVADCTQRDRFGLSVQYSWREGFRRMVQRREIL